jgi:hypothetical protein
VDVQIASESLAEATRQWTRSLLDENPHEVSPSPLSGGRGPVRGVRIPAALRQRLERVLRTEVAERERHRAEATEFLGRRLRQLANQREKLLRAYYADAIDVRTLKREQARINAEVAEAESQLANDGEKLDQAKQIIDVALNLAKDCEASYRRARPSSGRYGTEPSSGRSAFGTA